MFRIVEDACKFTADMRTGTVVVENDEPKFPVAIEQLREGSEAKNLALAYATTKGMSDAALNGMSNHPYSVNSKGLTQEDAIRGAGKPLPPRSPELQPARYRVDVPVIRGRP